MSVKYLSAGRKPSVEYRLINLSNPSLVSNVGRIEISQWLERPMDDREGAVRIRAVMLCKNTYYRWSCSV